MNAFMHQFRAAARTCERYFVGSVTLFILLHYFFYSWYYIPSLCYGHSVSDSKFKRVYVFLVMESSASDCRTTESHRRYLSHRCYSSCSSNLHSDSQECGLCLWRLEFISNGPSRVVLGISKLLSHIKLVYLEHQTVYFMIQSWTLFCHT